MLRGHVPELRRAILCGHALLDTFRLRPVLRSPAVHPAVVDTGGRAARQCRTVLRHPILGHPVLRDTRRSTIVRPAASQPVLRPALVDTVLRPGARPATVLTAVPSPILAAHLRPSTVVLPAVLVGPGPRRLEASRHVPGVSISVPSLAAIQLSAGVTAGHRPSRPEIALSYIVRSHCAVCLATNLNRTTVTGTALTRAVLARTTLADP